MIPGSKGINSHELAHKCDYNIECVVKRIQILIWRI